MNIKVMVAVETNQVMLVPFMIAQKYVLAMYGTVIVPPLLGFLNGFTFRMMINTIFDVMGIQIRFYR